MLDSKESIKGFYKKPPWLPAFPYNSLAVIFSLTFFFFLFLILYEDDEKPLLVAGSLSGALIILAFIFRELFLRRARNNLLKAQKRLDKNLETFSSARKREKLTIEQNFLLIKQIERKSEAAAVLKNLAEAHRNVFDDCNEYLKLVEEELKKISADSPRLTAILKGKRKVEQIRKYHLLMWVELEAQNLMNNLKKLKRVSDKVHLANRTLRGLKIALSYYPSEQKLIDSAKAIEELIISVKVSDYLKRADRASSQKKDDIAVAYYKKALEALRQSEDAEKRVLIEKIDSEIQKIVRGEDK